MHGRVEVNVPGATAVDSHAGCYSDSQYGG